MLKKVAGLSALIMVSPVLAHAEPVARWGQAIYPARVVPVAAPAPDAPAPKVEDVPPARYRHYSRRSRRSLVQEAVLAKPIETQPAPTPADTSKDSSVVPASGPHEEPAPTLKDLVSKHARESGVPEKLASAVVSIESRFNPRARGGRALGLMQIQYATARAAGFSGSASGLFEPETNLRYGMKVLADAYKASNGNVCMTLAKYQSGHLTTRMSAANRAYCARARALMAKA